MRQVVLALALLALLAAVDGVFLRGPGGPEEPTAVTWPERANRAMVVELVTDPANPLGLSGRDRREARRRLRALDRDSHRVLWASTRILDLLESAHLHEFDRLEHDLKARALMIRTPSAVLAAEAFDGLRSRAPGGRVEPPSLPPEGWDPDRDETDTYRRWREKTASWSLDQLVMDDEVEVRTPSTHMLDFAPRELLMVLVRLQSRGEVQGETAARVAGYARMLGEAEVTMEADWEGLHRLTVHEEGEHVKAERRRAEPDRDDPSFPDLARIYRAGGQRR